MALPSDALQRFVVGLAYKNECYNQKNKSLIEPIDKV